MELEGVHFLICKNLASPDLSALSCRSFKKKGGVMKPFQLALFHIREIENKVELGGGQEDVDN